MADTPRGDPAGEPPLRFSNEAKLRKQMRKRGWTEEQIREALGTTLCRRLEKLVRRYGTSTRPPASPW